MDGGQNVRDQVLQLINNTPSLSEKRRPALPQPATAPPLPPQRALPTLPPPNGCTGHGWARRGRQRSGGHSRAADRGRTRRCAACQRPSAGWHAPSPAADPRPRRCVRGRHWIRQGEGEREKGEKWMSEAQIRTSTTNTIEKKRLKTSVLVTSEGGVRRGGEALRVVSGAGEVW